MNAVSRGRQKSMATRSVGLHAWGVRRGVGRKNEQVFFRIFTGFSAM